MSKPILAKQPAGFRYGDSFRLFFEQFMNYANTVGCEEAAKVNLLLSFLDSKSFQLAKNIVFSEEEQASIAKDAGLAFPKFNIALSPVETIPARIALKYRMQGPDESINDFLYELRLLADKAFAPDDDNRERVLVDTFCTGLLDTDLSVKLLQKEFATLEEAAFAAQKQFSKRSIKNFMSKNRAETERAVDIFHTSDDDGAMATKSILKKVSFDLDLKQGQNQPPEYNHNFQKNISTEQSSRASQSTHMNSPQQGTHDMQYRNTSQANNEQHNPYVYPPSQWPPTFQHNQGQGYYNQHNPGFTSQQQWPQQQYPQFPRAYQRSRNMGPKRCFFCNKAGHVVKTCFLKQRLQNNTGANSNSAASFPQGPGRR